MSATDLSAIAAEMKAAQDQVRQIEPFTARVGGFDLVAAYEVADRIHARRIAEGAQPLGRKIGFTNPEMWKLYGVREPVWAHVYRSTVEHVGTRGRCALSCFTEPKIEPEIVFHFAKTPPAGGDLTAILDCIDWVAHGFEIVQSHFPGWRFQAADTVADAALHGRLLIGEPLPVAALGAEPVAILENFVVRLSGQGQLREIGKGSNVLGSPLAAIAHLLEVLSGQPQFRPLHAGEIVTTGTLTTALPIKPGETWTAELEGIALQGLAVEFVE